MNREYKESGYFVVRHLFTEEELRELAKAVLEFHGSWKCKNSEFYSKKAVNSAYITGTEHLGESKRNVLFKFIGSSRLMKVVSDVIPERPAFMNTQLFFNPVNADQKNYWHRDSQYHMTAEEQQEALSGPNVVHFRIPLANEPGIELVPGTHKRWDTDEELDVRLENNGHKNYEDISTGVRIKLEVGDLLVFSANMIHRGLYGMDRLSLDIIFCDTEPSLIKFASDDCLPGHEVLRDIEDPSAFLNTINLKTNNNAIHATGLQ
ncbi:MAG: phytanoyl-CoA dioxygenase family protein [Pseudomonadales bacterium]|nr:phytanoyl-CoA dioxygenase family protein [Pseudomonadales bacterium]